MKKLVIALVCVGLLAALTIPSIYSAPKWPTYRIEFMGEDVTGEAEQCGSRRRFISSHNINLSLSDKFGSYTDDPVVGQYLDLTEHKDVITMQFFFFDPSNIKKKVMLKVVSKKLEPSEVWLSEEFTIVFNDPDAVINSTKGKEKILWGPGNVNITVVCVPQE